MPVRLLARSIRIRWQFCIVLWLTRVHHARRNRINMYKTMASFQLKQIILTMMLLNSIVTFTVMGNLTFANSPIASLIMAFEPCNISPSAVSRLMFSLTTERSYSLTDSSKMKPMVKFSSIPIEPILILHLLYTDFNKKLTKCLSQAKYCNTELESVYYTKHTIPITLYIAPLCR